MISTRRIGRIDIKSLALAAALMVPGTLAPVVRRGVENVSPTKRYYCGKIRGTARSNHRHREKLAQQRRDENRQRLIQLDGNPPGYTYAHRDRLVRLCGARRTNELERRIRACELKFADAVELAEGKQ